MGVVVDRDLGKVHLVGGLHAVEGSTRWSDRTRGAPSRDTTAAFATTWARA